MVKYKNNHNLDTRVSNTYFFNVDLKRTEKYFICLHHFDALFRAK